MTYDTHAEKLTHHRGTAHSVVALLRVTLCGAVFEHEPGPRFLIASLDRLTEVGNSEVRGHELESLLAFPTGFQKVKPVSTIACSVEGV